MPLLSLATGLDPLIAMCIGLRVDKSAVVELVWSTNDSPCLLLLLLKG